MDNFQSNANVNAPSLDLRGLRCPLPAIRARKYVSDMKTQAQIILWVSDPAALRDIPLAIADKGWRIISSEAITSAPIPTWQLILFAHD